MSLIRHTVLFCALAGSCTLSLAMAMGVFTVATLTGMTDNVIVQNDAGRRLMEYWMLDLIIRLVVIVLLIVGHVTALLLYWVLYIKPDPKRYIPAHAVIPQDLQGKFTHDTFDCCSGGMAGTCMCFLFCPTCAIADLWFRAGHIHKILGNEMGSNTSCDQSCAGWQWFVGVCGYCLLADSGCAPCAMAFFRTGLPDGDSGDIIPHRKRFNIPSEGFNTLCQDCCLWCWCAPCAGVQEYRQIMALLDRGPVEVAPPPAVTLVGSPVQVVGTPVQVVGTPVEGEK